MLTATSNSNSQQPKDRPLINFPHFQLRLSASILTRSVSEVRLAYASGWDGQGNVRTELTIGPNVNESNIRMSTMSCTHQDSWNAIFAPAAQSASDALSRWTNGRIRLELDDVTEIGMEQMGEMLPMGSAPSTMVIVGIAGDLGGQLILIFEDSSAKTLVQTLLNRKIAELDAWGELEWSALKETGNICASSFLSAIRAFAEQAVLLPCPPTIVRDYVSCVIEQAVMPQLM